MSPANLASPSVVRRNLINLCLVSRQFLPPARRALYRAPLEATLQPCFSLAHAVALVGALEGRSGLGSLVRNLDSLASWARDIDTYEASRSLSKSPRATKDPPSFLQRGHTVGWSFAYVVVKACPSVLSLSLPISTAAQVTKLVKPLRDLTSVQRVQLEWAEGSTGLTRSLLLYWCEETRLDQLASLSVPDLYIKTSKKDQLRNKISTLYTTLQSIELCSVIINFTTLASLVPTTTPSSLRSLSISFSLDYHVGYISPTLTSLLNHIGAQLHTFALITLDIDYPGERRRLSQYGVHHSGLDYPLEIFSLLPNLVHSTLRGCRTLSLDKVTSLLTSSTNLKTLDFAEGVWLSFKTKASKTEEATRVDFPIKELARAFSGMEELEWVNLGWVPVTEWEKIVEMEGLKNARGQELKVEYVTCGSETLCYSCGEYH